MISGWVSLRKRGCLPFPVPWKSAELESIPEHGVDSKSPAPRSPRCSLKTIALVQLPHRTPYNVRCRWLGSWLRSQGLLKLFQRTRVQYETAFSYCSPKQYLLDVTVQWCRPTACIRSRQPETPACAGRVPRS